MKFLTILSFLACFTAYTQAPKKISKMFGDDFVQMNGTKDYPLIPSSENTFYPSWTMKGDTTGASNGSEFLLFEDSISFYENELFKFFKTEFVTNAEWNAFQDRVMDSIMREKLYLNQDPSAESKNRITPKQYRQLKISFVDSTDTEKRDAGLYFFTYSSHPWNYDYDWRKKIDQRIWRPLIGDMYTRPNERFLKTNPLDERKWNYKFENPSNGWIPILGLAFEEINVSKDHDVWATYSKHPFDMYYNFSNYYGHSNYFNDSPVIGVLGTQIKAFLKFIEDEYQHELNSLSLPYNVRVSLPSQKELNTINYKKEDGFFGVSTFSKDMTTQWQITNNEYLEFLDYVEDSICREAIYLSAAVNSKYDVSSNLLNYENAYYDEFNMKWKTFDPNDALRNRAWWSLNFDYRWEKKFDKNLADSTLAKFKEKGVFKKHSYVYDYEWVDYKRRSDPGDLVWTYFHEEYSGYECKNVYADCRDKEMSNGVRRHEDNGRYMLRERVSLYPGFDCREHNESCELLTLSEDHKDKDGQYVDCGRCAKGELEKAPQTYDFTANPDALIQNLTYHQALAYYNWKYQKQNVFKDSETAIYDDLVPSEEEFKRVQAGEKMIYKSQEIFYPSPLFRYVVHFYEK